jgi:hypothetical protein
MWVPPSSAFAGHRFPPEVIVVAVRGGLGGDGQGVQRALAAEDALEVRRGAA